MGAQLHEGFTKGEKIGTELSCHAGGMSYMHVKSGLFKAHKSSLASPLISRSTPMLFSGFRVSSLNWEVCAKDTWAIIEL